MRKLVLSAIVAVAALSFAPGHSDPGPQCATTPNYTGSEEGADQVCTYTAGGRGGYVAATPNDWTITITRNNVTTVAASGELEDGPSAGSLLTEAGDVVTITQENACAVAPVCGQGGAVLAAG